MANRDDRPLCGLGRNRSRRGGMKNTVSHYILSPSALTSTALQSFSNNLTMPPEVLDVEIEDFDDDDDPYDPSEFIDENDEFD